MKLIFAVLGIAVLSGFLGICGNSTGSVAAEKPRPSFPHTRDAVIRVYVDGRYVGSGIVVSSHGHIVTSLRIIAGRGGDQTKLAVDDGTVAAKMLSRDPAHDLALIKADRTYRWPATLVDRRDQQGDNVNVIGYSEVLGSPPVVEKRTLEAHVSRLHYQGESVSGLDLSDICLVSYRNEERSKIKEEGSAAFLTGNGKLLGMGFGKLWQSNELMLMPADTIRQFMKQAGLTEEPPPTNPL